MKAALALHSRGSRLEKSRQPDPMPHRKSYFFRGLVLAVAVVAIPLVGLLAYALHTLRGNDIAATHESLTERAAAGARLADGAFDRVKLVLDFLGSRPGIRSLDPRACDIFVKGFPVRSSLMTEIGIIREDGRPVCLASDPYTPPISFKERPWFKQALEGGDLNISKPYQDLFTGRWSVVMSRALRSPEGERMAILAVAIDVETMADRFLPLSGLPDGSNFGLALADGTMLAISGGRAKWFEQPSPEIVRSQIASAVHGPTECEALDGTVHLHAAAPMRLFNMHATVSVPRHDVMVGSEIRARQSAVIAAVVIVIALMLSWVMARRLSIPILSLTGTAREVCSGNLCAAADESLPGEFKLLAREFNKALNAVRESEDARRARASAEAASRAKSDFLANMSHEIRTPINAILGMTDLALRQRLNPKARDYISKVQQSSFSLLSIINDILDFSKIEAGKLAVEDVEFSIQDVLNRVTAVVGIQAHRRSVEMLFDVASDVPEMMLGDSLRVEQVLINLCSNAIKFSREGDEVLLTIRDHQGGTRFSVRDRGPGLNKEQINQIFESFNQLEPSTTRTHGGTGLGLTISKQLVELMGGKIEVASEVGVGSEFYFTLPRKAVANIPISYPLEISPLASARVLVIDDSPEAGRILTNALNNSGSYVEVVETTAAARILARRGHSFDVVLIDSDLQAVDSTGPIEDLRAAGYSNAHFILLANYGDDQVSNKIDEFSLSGCVTKPFTQRALTQTINDALSGSLPIDGDIQNIPDKPPPVLKGIRVLLVEDIEFNQILARDLLESVAGMRVTVAGDGEEALFLLSQGAIFDLVLMDVQMPQMDGYEVTRRIRSLAQFENLPVIAMTAYAMSRDKQRCLDAGMNDYIMKPFRPSELFSTLCRWLDKGGASRNAVASPKKEEEALFLDHVGYIPSVDSAEGLRRCLGMKDLYDRMILRFLETHEEDTKAMQNALLEDDLNAIRALAHNTMSSAGTIGAKNLCNLAREVQNMAISNYESGKVREIAEAFVMEYKRVIAELQQLAMTRNSL